MPPPLIQFANGGTFRPDRIWARQHIPIALADQQRRLRKRADLADMVALEGLMPTNLNLVGRELELREPGRLTLTLGATAFRRSSNGRYPKLYRRRA